MKKIYLLSGLLFGVCTLHAQNSVFQASLTPDIAIHPRTTFIGGLSLSIWGENPQSSLALGLVNGSTGNSSGLSWGLVNYADSYHGLQLGFINYTRQEFIGWQKGFINCAQGSFEGLQSGGINYGEDVRGLQLGFINYSHKLDGLQIGFLNVAANNGWFNELPDKFATAFPIVNWSF